MRPVPPLLLALALARGALSCSSASHESPPAPAACPPGGTGAYTSAFYDTLSEFCMVSMQGGKVTPEAGVVPYDLNTPLFSDYATKLRTVWVPPGQSVPYSDGDRFEFPVGSILTKSFGYPADMRDPASPVRWLETRVLVRAPDGWRSMSYVWSDDQKEAYKKAGGKNIAVSWTDADGASAGTTYVVPTNTQCKKCHAALDQQVTIGPKARQLNRDYPYPDGSENQLTRWSKRGFLTGAPDPASAPRLAVWNDPSTGSADERARAYLEGNCGHCHGDAGDARTSGLTLLSRESDPYRFGACKTPVAAGKAAADMFFDIVPGSPDRSILVYRMASTEPSVMMPEIGRSLQHKEGVQLVSDWVAGLSGSCGSP